MTMMNRRRIFLICAALVAWAAISFFMVAWEKHKNWPDRTNVVESFQDKCNFHVRWEHKFLDDAIYCVDEQGVWVSQLTFYNFANPVVWLNGRVSMQWADRASFGLLDLTAKYDAARQRERQELERYVSRRS